MCTHQNRRDLNFYTFPVRICILLYGYLLDPLKLRSDIENKSSSTNAVRVRCIRNYILWISQLSVLRVIQNCYNNILYLDMARLINIHKYFIKNNTNHGVYCIVFLHLYFLYNISVDRLTMPFDEHNYTYAGTYIIIRLAILKFVEICNERFDIIYILFDILIVTSAYSIAYGAYDSTMWIFTFLQRLPRSIHSHPTHTRSQVDKYLQT